MNDSEFTPNWFSKPGDTLAALMAQRGLTVGRLAELLVRDESVVRGILLGTADIDDELAARLSRFAGGTKSFWRRRQELYERNLATVAESIPDREAAGWLKALPLKDMVSYGWFDRPVRRNDIIKLYLSYFGVNSPEEWKDRYTDFAQNTAFRTSAKFKSKIGALSAWLRKGEIEANLLSCKPWDASLLKSRVAEIRTLTKNKSPSYFIPRLKDICSAAGVAVVFVRAPSGCRASGAARFVSPEKAMIILSFRYLSDDHFWFTFFHEIAHLLLHGRSATYVDGDEIDSSEQEAEANSFAGDVLIPLDRHDELLSLVPRSERVVRFAVSVGVSPGIVVGQLQHRGVIGHNQLNFLKRKYNWDEITAIPV